MKCENCKKELFLENFMLDLNPENQGLVELYHCESCDIVFDKNGNRLIENGVPIKDN